MARKPRERTVGDVFREAGIEPSDFAHCETTPGRKTPKSTGRKRKRTAKSRAKMWHITGLLEENPNISDADIQRSIRDRFKKKDGVTGESVDVDIIDEARYIFARKVESGEITVKGKRAHLANVQRGFVALSDNDKRDFLLWIQLGAGEEKIRRRNESLRDFKKRCGEE